MEGRCNIKHLVASGGMPSSHSATVTALAAAIGFQEGLGGPLFAMALVFACVVGFLSRILQNNIEVSYIKFSVFS